MARWLVPAAALNCEKSCMKRQWDCPVGRGYALALALQRT